MTLGPITTGIDGVSLSQEECDVLTHPLINGVILFTRNYQEPEQLLALCKSIKKLDPNLLISVDHEGGRVQRFQNSFTLLPTMQDAFTNAKNIVDLSYFGFTLAAELLASHIDFSYTPCVDINGISEVIGNRAFSSKPTDVIQAATHLIEGLNQAGMKNVVKHFPGHGSVGPDSHTAMPVDSRSLDEILKADFLPFAHLVKNGLADAVMPAHVIYDQVDTKPACFSPFWLQTILRQQLKFDGAIISDDMGMQGAVQMGDYPTRVEHALLAGCDSVLMCNEKQGLFEVLDKLSISKYQSHGHRMTAFNHRTYPEWDAVKSDKRWLACQKLIQQHSP
jgi:beta-N-acetylhexosaminidase